MKYLLTIYSNEKETMAAMAKDPGSMQRVMEMHNEFGKKFAASMRGGEALHPSTEAMSVHNKAGKISVTHGPFAETKEQLGGYYIIEADSIDAAVEIAKSCPCHESGGTFEVRQIVDFGP